MVVITFFLPLLVHYILQENQRKLESCRWCFLGELE
jgi:hypothetical protein